MKSSSDTEIGSSGSTVKRRWWRTVLFKRLLFVLAFLVSFVAGVAVTGVLSVRSHFALVYRGHGWVAAEHVEILALLRQGDVDRAIRSAEGRVDYHIRRSAWRPMRMSWEGFYLPPEELPAITLDQWQEVKAYFDHYPNPRLSSQTEKYLARLPQREREGLKSKFAQNYLGKPSPKLSVSRWIGPESVSLNELKGKVVLLDFWATSCGGCIGRMPQLEALYQDYQEEGFEVIGVHMPTDGEEVATFLEQNNYSYLFFIDTGETYRNYAVSNLPTYYLIDREGNLAWGPNSELPSRSKINTLIDK